MIPGSFDIVEGSPSKRPFGNVIWVMDDAFMAFLGGWGGWYGGVGGV